MKSRNKIGLGALGVVSLSLALTSALPALADTSAQGNDAVFVGSDTLQFASTFVADGDPNGDAGYNAGSFNRVFDFFSTGDANGRFTLAGGVSGTPGTAAETGVLRAGTQPVLRPNGSGAGVAALTLDSPAGPATNPGPAGGGYQGLTAGSITLARMSRLPNATEIANCDALKGCGGLHAYEIANDTLGIAATTGKSGTKATNAVALNATQLWNIYNCTNTAPTVGDPNSGDFTHWNSAAIGGTSADSIIPVIPQGGSGSRVFFLATIDAASGHGSDPSLSPTCVKTAQEHDPTGITGQATTANPNGAADAIEPFSQARLNLINGFDIADGAADQVPYFANSGGAAGSPAPGYAVNSLAIVGSTATTTAFSTVRAVYLVARNADVLNTSCSSKTSPTCFLPGGKQTQLQALITSGTASVYGGGSFASNIQYAGFTPKFQDCGVDPGASSPCVTAP